MNDDQQQPPMNGNDDLAKTLNEGLQFEETPMNGAPADAAGPGPAAPALPTPPAPDEEEEDQMKMPTLDPAAGDPDNEPMGAPSLSSTPPAAPAMAPTTEPEPQKDDTKPTPEIHHPHAKGNHDKKDDDKPKMAGPAGNSDLDGLKASALEELRPLVGKLNLPAEERFDTLLLIIRSTDDQSLLEQAHDAAKEITDDTRRAQALLDVIKEIDYFSSKR